MSYSLNQKCYSCKKKPKCVDGNVISAAVSIIHSLGQEKGHLGGGCVTHDCSNYESVNATPAGAEAKTS
ncbi:MAG: hypothetical protein M0R70_12770 [Nitrospirae bacterium]|nr:hypothetical protein [Nitrospirota bacterium]